MKRELFVRLSLLVLLFSAITVLKLYFSYTFWPFWVGGVVGTFLPDIDHFLYVFVFYPLDLTSQRIIYYFKNKSYKEGLQFLYQTKEERTDLIFHKINFVLIFAVLTFWVMSSSGSLFGRGLVMGFWFHLTFDYYKKYKLEPIVIGMIALLLISATIL